MLDDDAGSGKLGDDSQALFVPRTTGNNRRRTTRPAASPAPSSVTLDRTARSSQRAPRSTTERGKQTQTTLDFGAPRSAFGARSSGTTTRDDLVDDEIEDDDDDDDDDDAFEPVSSRQRR